MEDKGRMIDCTVIWKVLKVKPSSLDCILNVIRSHKRLLSEAGTQCKYVFKFVFCV